MSLTSAVKKKLLANRDPQHEKEAQEWIESVIGEKFPPGHYEDGLRDGIILCKLMNKLKPDSVPKIATKGSDYALRDNISQFINAAIKYGVLKNDLFQTVDLFEKKNIALVTQSIEALRRQAEKNGFVKKQ